MNVNSNFYLYNCKPKLLIMNKLSPPETIFALSTPYGISAIAVIRVSGPSSFKVGKIFTKKRHLEARKVY